MTSRGSSKYIEDNGGRGGVEKREESMQRTEPCSGTTKNHTSKEITEESEKKKKKRRRRKRKKRSRPTKTKGEGGKAVMSIGSDHGRQEQKGQEKEREIETRGHGTIERKEQKRGKEG